MPRGESRPRSQAADGRSRHRGLPNGSPEISAESTEYDGLVVEKDSPVDFNREKFL